MDTSSNGLVSELIREGSPSLKDELGQLLKGEGLETKIDDQIVFSQLKRSREAVWSLLVASGYLKLIETIVKVDGLRRSVTHKLAITNYETEQMFHKLVKDWFAADDDERFPAFIRCMLTGNVEDMNTSPPKSLRACSISGV